MGVVTACMHRVGNLRCKREPGSFGDRKCIHIGAQRDRTPGERSANHANDAGARGTSVFDTECVELAFDQRLRFYLVKTKLGATMNRPPPFDHATVEGASILSIHEEGSAGPEGTAPLPKSRVMIGADLALALLVNRTAAAYSARPPAYITYRERTSVTVPSLGRSQEIDRSVEVRNADNYAIMHDLPHGATRIGEAFPIIPYFDPFSSFTFSYYANLKAITITLRRGTPIVFPIPAPEPGDDLVVPYISFLDPSYAPDSTPNALHILIAPTPLDTGMYPSEVQVDPATGLPQHIVLSDSRSDMRIGLTYRSVDGYWVVVRGVFSATEHALGFSFNVRAVTRYDEFTFPTSAPDPALMGTPRPIATP